MPGNLKVSFVQQPNGTYTNPDNFRFQGAVMRQLSGTWYNTTRMHSSLGYKSPAQFERDYHAKSAKTTTTTQPQFHVTTANPLG